MPVNEVCFLYFRISFCLTHGSWCTDCHQEMDKACASAIPVYHKLTRVPARRWQLTNLPRLYEWRHEDRPNRSDRLDSPTLRYTWDNDNIAPTQTPLRNSTQAISIDFDICLESLRSILYYLTSCGLYIRVLQVNVYRGRVVQSSDCLKDSARQSVWLISHPMNRGSSSMSAVSVSVCVSVCLRVCVSVCSQRVRQ